MITLNPLDWQFFVHVMINSKNLERSFECMRQR